MYIYNYMFIIIMIVTKITTVLQLLLTVERKNKLTPTLQ